MNMPKSTLSRRVALLEKRLGASSLVKDWISPFGVRFPPIEDCDPVIRVLVESPQRLVANPEPLKGIELSLMSADLVGLACLDWGCRVIMSGAWTVWMTPVLKCYTNRATSLTT